MRFILTSGEAVDGDWVDWPCPDCGSVGCECSEEYRANPQEMSRWSKLTREERDAEMAAIFAKIDAAFRNVPLVEVEHLGPGRIAA